MSGEKDNSAVIARILHGARWAALIRLGAQIISWGSTLIVVRFVSASDYGLNAMVGTPLELLFLLSTLGLDLALVRSSTLAPDVLRPAFGWLLFINGVLFCSYFFGSPLVAAYFGEQRLQPLAQVIAFVFLLVPFRVIPNAILDRELKFKLRAAVELVCSISAAIATLVLAVAGFGVWALVSGMLVSRVLAAVLLMVLQPWIMVPSFSIRAVKGMLALGGTMTLASALAMTSNMFPVLIGGPALGPALLGLYTVALQFAMLPLSKVMPIVNSIAFPAFSKFEGQPAAIGSYTASCLGTGAMVLLPLMTGLACASVAFTSGVLGSQWAEAALPLAILSLVMPARGVTLFLYQVMSGIGRADMTLKCTAGTWLFTLVAMLTGAQFGIGGLVAASACGELVGCAMALMFARRVMQLPGSTLAAAFRAPVLSVLPMAAGVLLCGHLLDAQRAWLVLSAQVAVGAVIYGVVVRLLFWTDGRRVLTLVRR